MKPGTFRPRGPGRHRQGRRKGKLKLYAPYGYRTTIRRFGHLLTWKEMTSKEQYVTAKRIRGAKNRNKYWAANGYANLKKARAAHARYRAEAIARGEVEPAKVQKFEEIAAGRADAGNPQEARDAEVYASGRSIRAGTVLLGAILPAGSYDPAYLMRREMRILDVMSRCPD